MSKERGERLAQVRERLTRWRQHHGGPGIPLPEALWQEAITVARSEGVSATARALRVDRWRLAARMGSALGGEGFGGADAAGRAGDAFVEIDASRLCRSAQRVVVRFERRGGDRIEVECDTAAVDVVGLAHTFFGGRR